jgi:diacylglycerol kinase (ATP)
METPPKTGQKVKQTCRKGKTVKIQLIFNPHSGRGKSLKMFPKILKRLRDAGYEVIPHRTMYRFHATEIVKNLNLYETDALVSLGGDGTAFEVLNGIMNNPEKNVPPIALIPVGTGNSFVKDMNIFTVEEGIQALLQGKHRPADVVRFTTDHTPYYFVNNLGFGFVADVSLWSEPYKKMGQTAYAMGVLREMLRLKPIHVTMEIDGKKVEHDANFVYFCNSVWVAGNMKISPNSHFDDGLMEVMVLNAIDRPELLKTFPKVFNGSHIDHPSVKVYQAKHVKVSSEPQKFCNPDGEIFGVTPLEVKILPGMVRYFYLEKQKESNKVTTGEEN